MSNDTITKREQLEAITKGVRDGLLHALGLDYDYMLNAYCQKAFRKEITDAIERGVREVGIAVAAKPCAICGLQPCFLEDGTYLEHDSGVELSSGDWTSLRARAEPDGKISLVSVGDGEAVYFPKFCPKCGRKLYGRSDGNG